MWKWQETASHCLKSIFTKMLKVIDKTLSKLLLNSPIKGPFLANNREIVRTFASWSLISCEVFSEKRRKMGMEEWRASDEALTYMAILPVESKLSSANLSTSVTLRVSSFSHAENGLRQQNLKNICLSGPVGTILLVELETSLLETMVMQNFTYKNRDRQIFLRILKDFRGSWMNATKWCWLA